MGVYLNPDNRLFAEATASEIYVDKTELIGLTNRVLGTLQKFVCISRPRRFGKFMAANIYNPKSVVDALRAEEFASYWTQTETYEALREYIAADYHGLKEAIISMLAGNYYKVNTRTFQNDMTTFKTKDDILTLLIHLGYLAYDKEKSQCLYSKYRDKGEIQKCSRRF